MYRKSAVQCEQLFSSADTIVLLQYVVLYHDALNCVVMYTWRSM